MADPIQRANYFKNQFLHVEDFTTEQAYHIEMRRRHNRALHTYGIAEGLQLTFSADATAVTVRAGMGIDNQGREIVLVSDQSVELADMAANRDVFITIAYDEAQAREQNETGVRGNTRVQELPKIERLLTKPAEGARLILGRVVRGGASGTQVQSVDATDRSQAGAIEGDVLLTPHDPAVSADDYVSLRWTGAKQGTLTGSLAIRKFAPVTPDGNLALDGGLRVDAANQAAGWGGAAVLAFGQPGSGEGITSRRVGGPNQGGLDLVTQGQVRLSITNGGNVGIGTVNPSQMLQVSGNARVNNLFLGDVGYGATWAGLCHADALGTAYGLLTSSDGRNTFLGKRSGGGYFAFRVDNNDRVRVEESGHLSVDTGNLNSGVLAPGIAFGDQSGEGIASRRAAGGNRFGLDFFTNSQSRLSITNGGNVGIGTMTPAHMLQVSGNAQVGSLFLGDVGYGPTWAGLCHAAALGTAYGLLTSSDGRNTFLGKRSGGGNFAFRVDNADRVRVEESGHLSVDTGNLNSGVLAPGIAFGDQSGEGIASRRAFGGNRFGLDLFTNGQSRLSITNAGNVGIGTANPAAKLQVVGDIRWANSHLSGDQGGSIELGGGAVGAVPYIDFHFGAGAADYSARLINDADQRLTVAATTLRQNQLCLSGGVGWSSISYNAHHGAGNSGWVAIDPNRRSVTIEMDDTSNVPRFEVWLSAAPGVAFTRRLSINGLTGAITCEGVLHVLAGKTGYVMDQFVNNRNEALEQGDVVVLGEAAPQHHYGIEGQIPIPEVDLTAEAYDRRVCGIVDTAHGSVEKAEPTLFDGTETDLDTTRVEPGQIGTFVTLGAFAHCKVDADIAAIAVGDLLTTSPTPRHAQKVLDADAARGAVIGKALAPLAKGRGKIPILVTLY